MATHSSVLAWRIPGTGEPGGCRLWGRTELEMTEATQQQQQLKENHTKISYLGQTKKYKKTHNKTKTKQTKTQKNKNPLKWLTEGFGLDMCLSLISFTVNLPLPMTLGRLTQNSIAALNKLTVSWIWITEGLDN